MDNHSFKSPVLGIDPVTKGKFVISYAYMIWPIENEFDEADTETFRGNIKIYSKCPEENPLYKIAKESPLRLQGLIASVDFGVEKRFIKIQSIKNYFDEEDYIELNFAKFQILTNLQYLDNIDTYRCDNLL